MSTEYLDVLRLTRSETERLLSLAKKEEIPYLAPERTALPLGRRNPGLRLLMHVRDEAHRFAQHYHHMLRRKKTLDS